MGYPIQVCELLNTLKAPAYIARVSVHDPKNVIKAKEAIKKAFENQVNGKGFSFVEVLSTCSTNWGMTPVESLKWLEDNMIPQFPLGVFRSSEEVSK
jgi:2-oxoglutarate ferredoxin oxidoreductase subunit beta